MEELVIRPAHIEDHASVSALCQGTFSWGDYIPEVFAEWLEDADGEVMVAELEGEVLGLVHLTVLSPHEGWLEGMRIRADWRRHGLAARLTHHAREAVLSKGTRVVRLAIDHHNFPSQRLAETMGFRPGFSLVEYTSTGGLGRAWPAQVDDLPKLLSLTEQGVLAEEWRGRQPVIGYNWKWSEVRPLTVVKLIAAKKVWTNGESWAVVDDHYPQDREVTVHTPYGRAEDVVCLMGGLYAEFQRVLRITVPLLANEGVELANSGWIGPEVGDVIYEYRKEE